MKRNKILVTGGAGYIGSHCIIALIDSGFDPIIVDNFSNSSKSVLQKLNQITKSKIKYYNFDHQLYYYILLITHYTQTR